MKSFFTSNLHAPSVFAIFAAIVTTQAQAILDTNNNSISDPYERQYNNGNLLPNTFLATNDDDRDGWSNAKEATAGTNPFEANPPDGIVALTITSSAVEGAFTLTWNTLVGKNYQLKVSTDLVNWSNLGDPIATTQNTHTIGVNTTQPDFTIPPTVFWQITVTDLDTDGDGLTNAEEHTLGTDPIDPDSDGDTLNDKAEILAGTNPREEDTDLDGIPDNLDATPLQNNAIADPDGENLAASLSTNLRGFWDFESQQGTAYPAVLPDRSGGGRHSLSYSGGPQAQGIPSMAAKISTQYVTIPPNTFQGQNTWTISGWLKFAKNGIINQGTGYKVVYALYDQQGTGPAPQNAPLAQGTILAVAKVGSTENWFVGGYKQTTYFNEYPNINGNPKTVYNGHNFTLPAGTLDDGKWHHFAVTRASIANGQKVYFDGALVFQGALLDYSVSYDANTTFTFGRLFPAHTASILPEAWADRLRVHSRLLDSAEITALYKQDIDQDGLWDITESKTLQNNYATSVTSHPPSGTPLPALVGQFIRSPYYYEVPATDTDGDGLSDIDEQTLGTDLTKPDTDGDGLLDGWEVEYDFDPLVAGNDATSDPDGDGLTNLQEYFNNTHPRNANTDGSGGNDQQEVINGSDPADSDNDTAPPAGEMENLPITINGDYTKWEVVFTGLGPDDKRVRRFRMDNYNTVKSVTFPIRKGNSYEVSMIYQSTIPGQELPWFCWEAKIDNKTDDGWLFENHWIVNNNQGLLAAHTHSQGVNKIAGKTVSLKPIEVYAVYEKDQVANRIPNPKKPNYYAISSSANPVESRKKYNSRLFVSTEPETGEVEITLRHVALPHSVASTILVVITDETGQVIKSKNLNESGETDISFVPSVMTLNSVFYVDVAFSGQESVLYFNNYMKNDGLSIQIISPANVQEAKGDLALLIGPFATTVAGSFYRTFLGDIPGPKDSVLLPPISRAIHEEPPTMIAGSIYDQTTWATEIPSYNLPNGSGASNIAETYFSKKAGYGLHQICRDLLEQNHIQIWNDFTTGSITTKNYTFPIPPGTSLSFYYAGANPPKYIWGGATYKNGSVTLKLKKNGNKIEASGIEMQAVIEDYYDFDFTRPDNSFSKRAATIEIAREMNSRPAGRIFHTLTHVDFAYDESTGDLINNGAVNGVPPLPFFNENGYIQDGNFLTTGGAGGTGNE